MCMQITTALTLRASGAGKAVSSLLLQLHLMRAYTGPAALHELVANAYSKSGSRAGKQGTRTSIGASMFTACDSGSCLLSAGSSRCPATPP
jgi:hypothetical protein